MVDIFWWKKQYRTLGLNIQTQREIAPFIQVLVCLKTLSSTAKKAKYKERNIKYSASPESETHVCLDVCLKTINRKVQAEFQGILIHTLQDGNTITFSKSQFFKFEH